VALVLMLVLVLRRGLGLLALRDGAFGEFRGLAFSGSAPAANFSEADDIVSSFDISCAGCGWP
jgi:hypothetical protein